jgi:NDP-sugar pyrophosphorylase family protein
VKAIILAGGKGVRLKPFTVNFPKPLVPLGDTPVIEALIQRLLHHGITDITLTLGHLAELIKAYFDHRKNLLKRATLTYVDEVVPTGTAGSLALVPDLRETFLVMNGDLLTDLNFHELIQFHRSAGAELTIASYNKLVKIDLGVLELTGNRLVGYHEKPQKAYPVSMGIYVYEPSVLDLIPKGEYLDFPTLVLKLLDAGRKVAVYPFEGTWLDIGRPDDYGRAQEIFQTNRELFTNAN